MKIWQCYPNLPAQTWWQTDDGRIALQGQGMCLDLMDGIMWGNTPTQLWECGDSTYEKRRRRRRAWRPET